MLLYVGYPVPKVPTTIHYSESWKVVPYYQSIEGACPKVVAPGNLSIPGNGLEGLSRPTPYLHSDWTVCPPAISGR